MLDSSPIQPPKSRKETLKRSVSTTSIASLPTPPRTRHKRTRSSGKTQQTSDSDELPVLHEERDHDSSDLEEAVEGEDVSSRKKRRTDEFFKGFKGEDWREWSEKAKKRARQAGMADVTSASPERGSAIPRHSSSPELPVVRNARARRAAATAAATLASPPLSHGKKTAKTKLGLVVPRPPRTPEPVASRNKRGLFPERDSGNNPFLVDDSLLQTFRPPKTPERGERPELVYVFRGVKGTFPNPLYNPSPEAVRRANLPPWHPDFSPSAADCPPRLLFPSTNSPRRSARIAAGSESPLAMLHNPLRDAAMPKTPEKKRTRRQETGSPTPRAPALTSLRRTPARTAPLHRTQTASPAPSVEESDSETDAKEAAKMALGRVANRAKISGSPVRSTPRRRVKKAQPKSVLSATPTRSSPRRAVQATKSVDDPTAPFRRAAAAGIGTYGSK